METVWRILVFMRQQFANQTVPEILPRGIPTEVSMINLIRNKER